MKTDNEIYLEKKIKDLEMEIIGLHHRISDLERRNTWSRTYGPGPCTPNYPSWYPDIWCRT